jgi:hypothetical protein
VPGPWKIISTAFLFLATRKISHDSQHWIAQMDDPCGANFSILASQITSCVRELNCCIELTINCSVTGQTTRKSLSGRKSSRSEGSSQGLASKAEKPFRRFQPAPDSCLANKSQSTALRVWVFPPVVRRSGTAEIRPIDFQITCHGSQSR